MHASAHLGQPGHHAILLVPPAEAYGGAAFEADRSAELRCAHALVQGAERRAVAMAQCRDVRSQPCATCLTTDHDCAELAALQRSPHCVQAQHRRCVCAVARTVGGLGALAGPGSPRVLPSVGADALALYLAAPDVGR